MNGESVRRGRAASRICAALACAWLLLAAACSPSFGGQPLAGSFLADNRPHELIYLDLSASGPAVAGILTLVTVDAELGTQADTFDVRGTADRERATLVAERFLGQPDATLTLARAGRDVTLTMPSFTGEPVSLTLQPATPDELNQRIGARSSAWPTSG